MSIFPSFDTFINESISKSQLKDIEKLADSWFEKYGIDVEFTNHFLERLNDPRNNPEIKFSEVVELFKKSAEALGKEFATESDELEAVIKDISNDLNLPIVIEPDGDPREDTKLITKTIMRKGDFKTTSKIFKV